MKHKINRASFAVGILQTLNLLLISAVLAASVGCGTTEQKKRDDDFFTSGSREADQRASQRMAKAEQLSGSRENNVKEAEVDNGKASQAEGKLTLYDRLGGEQGIAKIVDDFLARALADPRVNWQRKGIERGGFSLRRNDSMTWNATPESIARVKTHITQFFALATGGPARYTGKEMKSAHANLQITNAEFDAAVGDLKASLDKLKIPNQEQKELLAIVESTRPQVVEER